MTEQLRFIYESVGQTRREFVMRDAQIEMSRIIQEWFAKVPRFGDEILEEATNTGPGNASCAFIEAGTGTGKSLAYLIPSILTQKKVMVSTNTKSLQKQLIEELTNLKKVFPSLTYAILQGASNYACKLKSRALSNSHIENWITKESREGGDGTVSSFRKNSKKNNMMLWSAIQADPTVCGSKCDFFEDCFLNTARSRAATANISVVNHDLLLRQSKSEHGLVSLVDRIVIDEAHNLPDKIRNAYSHVLHSKTVSSCIAAINFKLSVVDKKRTALDLAGYTELEENLFDYFPEQESKQTIRLYEIHEEAKHVATRIKQKLTADISMLDTRKKEGEESKIVRILYDLMETLNRIFFNKEPDDWAVFFTGNKKITLEAVPLDIAPIVREIFGAKKVVLTSATLSDAGNFDFFKATLGQESSPTYTFPSPFDKKNVAMFVSPNPLDPIQPSYHDQLANYVSSIHRMMNGKSLFLFTNKEDMTEVHKRLSLDDKKDILFQETTADVPRMIESLKTNSRISLAGLSTLWEGIDVAGPALSAVCVTRMPFSNPDEPLVSALKERYTKFFPEGGFKFFGEYDLPLMLIKLKQAIGRLVRHESDTGLLAVLDNRFLRKNYKDRVIHVLQDYDCYTDLDEAISNIPKRTIGRLAAIKKFFKK